MFLSPKYDKALEAYEEVLQYDPNNACILKKKGDALTHLNRDEEALAAYEQALRLDPNNSSAKLNKLNVLTKINRNK